MDLKYSRCSHTANTYSPQLEHALQVIAAALSAVCWMAYQGDIALHDQSPAWRWRLVFKHCALDASTDSFQEQWPHRLFPNACRRLAQEVQHTRSTAHEMAVGGEAASDPLGLQRLAWLVIQPSGICNCFEFIRDASSDGYNHSDQRVLSVLTQEFILPCLSHDETADDDRALDEIGVALSRRQREVLAGLVAGQSVKEVASVLNLSPHTVNDYVKAIYRHFDVCSRGELLAVVHGRMRQARRSEII